MSKVCVLITIILLLTGCGKTPSKEENQVDYQAIVTENINKLKKETTKIVLAIVDYENKNGQENNVCSLTLNQCGEYEEYQTIEDEEKIAVFLNYFTEAKYTEDNSYWLMPSNYLIQFFTKDNHLLLEYDGNTLAIPKEDLSFNDDTIFNNNIDKTSIAITIKDKKDLLTTYFKDYSFN